ncbi:MAG: hypothetical protein JO089_07880 [Alphaproteobacteria bacterium]|nr:hypothetical protein [Alphaproteobacteria bacterium]
MWTSIRYIFLCALRDRLFTGLIAGIVIASLVAAMLGSAAVLEEKEMKLAFAAAASRLMVAVGVTVFVCFQLRSAFDSREIDVMLSRPISRPQLALAFWMGFSAVATLIAMPVALALFLITPMSWSGFFSWMASLVLESWLVVALALFAALTLNSAVASVLATLGFYVLSRMMAFFVMTASTIAITGPLVSACRYALAAISMIMLRLDFFAKTEWLIYGLSAPSEAALFVVQALIFLPLLLAACVVDFQRKQF